MKTIIKIKTYKCACGYYQDFEPTPELMAKNFGNQNNICPSCHFNPLEIETDEAKKATITIMGEDELDTHEIPDGKDEQGNEKKRKLTKAEKDAYKVKIQADIIKFQAMQ